MRYICLKTSACFSHVNLSFITGISAKNSKAWRQNYFSSPTEEETKYGNNNAFQLIFCPWPQEIVCVMHPPVWALQKARTDEARPLSIQCLNPARWRLLVILPKYFKGAQDNWNHWSKPTPTGSPNQKGSCITTSHSIQKELFAELPDTSQDKAYPWLGLAKVSLVCSW